MQNFISEVPCIPENLTKFGNKHQFGTRQRKTTKMLTVCIILSFIVVILVPVIIVVGNKVRNAKREELIQAIEPEIVPALKEVSAYYKYSHYITESERLALNDKYDGLAERLKKVCGTRQLRQSPVCESAERLCRALSGTNEFKKENNRQFICRELEQNKAFFDTVLKYPLDAQQREAIVSLEDNILVISSAGSGKTMTTVGKVRYLVDKQGVNPAKILLITFTRKAAESLSERLGEKLLKCVTFHRLALDIIAEATGRRPTIADAGLPAMVYHDLMDNDASFKSAVSEYILNSRYRMPDQFEYSSREEYIAARQKYGVNS